MVEMTLENFQDAVFRNNPTRIRYFLEQNPSWARHPRSDGLEPVDCLWLWQAVTVDETNAVLECIDILMEFGATPNTGRCVRELLMHCSRASVSVFLRALMRYGCRATTEDLILALRRQLFDNMDPLIPLLLRAGADPNGISMSLPIILPINTCMILPTFPLHYAVAKRNIIAVMALLEGGADPYIVDPVTTISARTWARHVASFPSRSKDPVSHRILRLFEDLEKCRQWHHTMFPALKKELMEYVWHPDRLAQQGYFGIVSLEDHSTL